MDCDKVGKLILSLRKERGMTQKELAKLMHLSDRTISKWERGAGCPDVSLLQDLSDILDVNIEQILQGDLIPNETDGGNMKKIKFYACPTCGSIVYSTGEPDISCCGRKLKPLTAQENSSPHEITIEEIENEFYVTFNHEMTKQHYISFVAYVSYNSIHMVKLYPEQSPEARFPFMRGGDFYYYCSEHGLFKKSSRR